ncbi:MAG: ATP-binding protein [Nitrospiraceae bacterium]|nr:ATP-binding protein [Nitrospiraceae bacterium]
MKTLTDLNTHTSIKTKGILYMMLMLVIIYVSVSLIVLSNAHKNLDLQLKRFHVSIAQKLAVAASDSMITNDYGPLVEQVRQMKLSSHVQGVRAVDRRGIVVLSDNLAEIGRHDPEMAGRLRSSGRNDAKSLSGTRVFIPVSVGGDALGALQVDFNKSEKAGLDREFMKTKIQLIYLSFLIFAAGIWGSFIVSSVLTKPLTKLVREIESFEKEITFGNSNLYDPAARDESVQLRQAFQHMIGNLKKYLKEFRKMSEEREKITCMATVGQMSAQIAHEMRNSLYAIRGAAAEIKKINRQPEIGEYADIVKDESLEMMIMADEFLRFSRIPSPAPRPCRITEIVDRVVELLDSDLEDAGVRVTKLEFPDVPKVMGDPALLKQVFMNLFINAIQAMKGGGMITVEYNVSGEWVEVHIMDTGPGIPGNIASKIFQPFFTTKNEGSGLGLATAYKIILTHHGEIKLLSSDEGAHFLITLPLAGAEYVRSYNPGSWPEN